jgi:hypothetical protein
MEMRSLRSLHLLLSFAVLLACAGICSASEQGIVHQATPENYRVYSASLPFGYHTAGLAIAIRSRTIAVPDLTYASHSVQKEFASMQQDPALGAAIREMLSQSPLDLAPRFHTSEAVLMLNSDELDGQLHLKETPLARKSGWRAFNESHHDVDGLTEVSAIGYNPAHTVAIFYAIHRSGTGCADEGFEVLRKTKGQWRRSPDQGFSFAACN